MGYQDITQTDDDHIQHTDTIYDISTPHNQTSYKDLWNTWQYPYRSNIILKTSIFIVSFQQVLQYIIYDT